MTVYDFTFVVDSDPHADDFEDKFIEAGCDDATFILLRGAAALSFDREAASYKEAVLTAYRQIVETGASIVRFEPDFLVSAADIANRSGLSRQAVNLFQKGERREGFPLPLARLSTPSPLWDWVDVSKWLFEHKKVSEEVYHEALVSRIMNAGAQINHAALGIQFDVEKALQAA